MAASISPCILHLLSIFTLTHLVLTPWQYFALGAANLQRNRSGHWKDWTPFRIPRGTMDWCAMPPLHCASQRRCSAQICMDHRGGNCTRFRILGRAWRAWRAWRISFGIGRGFADWRFPPLERRNRKIYSGWLQPGWQERRLSLRDQLNTVRWGKC